LPRISSTVAELKTLSKERTKLTKEIKETDQEIERLGTVIRNAVGIYAAMEATRTQSGVSRVNCDLQKREVKLRNQANEIINGYAQKIGHRYADDHNVKTFLWGIYEGKPTQELNAVLAKKQNNSNSDKFYEAY
jgi:hypothetical protein